MQQVISGLSTCQRRVEKLLESVQRSNERIDELTDKVHALESELKLFSKTDHVQEADQSTNGGGRGTKRKRSTSSVVVQVSMLFFYYLATNMHIWRSVIVRMRTS